MRSDSHNTGRQAAPFLNDRNLRFPRKPQLASDLRIFDMPDGLGVQSRGGECNTVLRGPKVDSVWSWLSRLLDGSHTVEDLIGARPEGVSDSDVVDMLWFAFVKGLIIEGGDHSQPSTPGTEGTEDTLDRQMLFWGRKLGLTRVNSFPEQVQNKLATASVALFGNGMIAAVTSDLLSRSGLENMCLADWEEGTTWTVTVASRSGLLAQPCTYICGSIDAVHRWLKTLTPAPDLLITATRDLPVAVFEVINRHCLENNIRWLRGHDDLVHIEIGPYFDPQSSACFTCMRLRQMSCMDHPLEEELYQQHLAENPEQMPGGIGESLAFATTGAGLLATEAIRIITEISPPSTENCVVSINFTGSIVTNRFLKVPRCPDCYRGSHSASLDAR